MYEITREMCKIETKSKWQSAFVLIIILSILAIIRACMTLDSIWWSIFVTAIFVFMAIISYIIFRKKFKGIEKNDEFYIVEDVFINVREVRAFANRFRRYRAYYEFDIKFSRNGLHHMLLYSKDEPEEIEADYSAVFFSNPGDKFYLLMMKDKEKDIILKCFNAKYYKISEYDFNLVDGKYIPKKV